MRPLPKTWHEQIEERTAEVYDPATTAERIEEILDAAMARADALLPRDKGEITDYDATRERRAWNELARVCMLLRARRNGSMAVD